MALVAEEAIHIVKCIPVQVKVRHTTKCYMELPVWQGNNTAYLTPRTRIIIKHGNHRECSAILPTLYNIDGIWHKFTPKPMEAIALQDLRPITHQTWQYSAPSSLASSGIYTQSDIDTLRDHVMFPAEKTAVLNTVARGMAGKTIVPGTVNILGVMDETTLTTTAKNAASKSYGTASLNSEQLVQQYSESS
jgi:hypothetical protein